VVYLGWPIIWILCGPLTEIARAEVLVRSGEGLPIGGDSEAEHDPVRPGSVTVALKNTGLRGLVVADTMISDVDGEAGRLFYRGYAVEELAANSTYEEVAHLLIEGRLPEDGELREFQSALVRARRIAAHHVRLLGAQKKELTYMEVLQSAVPVLAADDPVPGDESKRAVRIRATDLVGKVAALATAAYRMRSGLAPLEPSRSLSHAGDILRMLLDREPEAEAVRALDAVLILHADHSFNASTFTARTVASTRASLPAAAGAALGALSGELHGGANERVMAMFEEIGDLSAVERFVKKKLDAGERVMGMGHAVYQTMDPRARVLRSMAEQMARDADNPVWFNLAQRVEEVVAREFMRRKGKKIYPNVDFFSAVVYRYMGIPKELYTPLFAIARAAGWGAHVIEERFGEAHGRPALYRPLAEYTGDYCGPGHCSFVPLDRRRS